MGSTTALVNGLQSGLARGLGGVLQSRRAYQAGADDETAAQTKIAQALASIRASDAAAALHEQQAAGLKSAEARAQARPGMVDAALAASAGVDVPTLTAWRQRHTTGQAPQVPMGPPTEDGGMGLGAAQFPPEMSTKLAQALARFLPAATAEKDLNPEQWAKAAGLYQDQDQEAAVMRGELSPMALALQRYAAKGSAPYHFDATGAVGNQLTGALDTANPMAQGTIKLKAEQAGAQKANAAQSYAAAGASNAHAGLFRAQTDEAKNGTGRSGGKAPAGYRWLADGVTLEAIPGGPADPNTKGAKLAKPPTEGQSKALLFGTRMAAADEALSELEREGVMRPGNIKTVAEGLAGAVPLLGESLAKGAGVATNWTQSGSQQKVEQAQRDFINAVLRRESGAAIGAGEFANAAQQYFPQPGDKPEVLRQKAANRRAAIAGFKAEVGDAFLPEFDKIVGESRAARRNPKKPPPPQSGGATGSWDAPDGWSMERVN